MQVYARNATIEYQAFEDKVNRALLGVPSTESTVRIEDLNAHVGIDTDTWKGVIKKTWSRSRLNENAEYLLQL